MFTSNNTPPEDYKKAYQLGAIINLDDINQIDVLQMDVVAARPEGALLLEALKLQGMDIPNFCYYWNLPAQASCRMCLVRIEKVPRLQPSCTTTVKEGMVVEANSPEIIDMRRGSPQGPNSLSISSSASPRKADSTPGAPAPSRSNISVNTWFS